ncbi:MAG: HEPN domain-containing protein [Ignavibacteriaceae bacterium]
MTDLVNEWTNKATADYHTALREIKVKNNPNWDGVCFHCQQAIEKLLKALLQKNKIKFGKTHDLGELIRLLDIYPELGKIKDDLEWLSIFSVEFRYPGEQAERQDAVISVEILKRSWNLIKPLTIL